MSATRALKATGWRAATRRGRASGTGSGPAKRLDVSVRVVYCDAALVI